MYCQCVAASHVCALSRYQAVHCCAAEETADTAETCPAYCTGTQTPDTSMQGQDFTNEH